tara:strand:- start:16943 stop:17800 length:858 start_codon:yes stop_codon:yes gene_type:complete
MNPEISQKLPKYKTFQVKRYRTRRLNARQEVIRQLRLRTTLEKNTFAKLRLILDKNIFAILSKYEQTQNFSQADQTVLIRKINNEISELMNVQLQRTFREVINLNIETYDTGAKDLDFISFNRPMAFTYAYTEYLRTREPLYTNISIATATMLDSLLVENQELSIPLQVKAIRSRAISLNRTRAARIARTETHNASSYASQMYNETVSKELGIEMKKRWVSVGDDRTRPSHARANGQVRAIDEDFEINGALMKQPGDSRGGAKNVVNCRCVVVYVDNEDLDYVND